ncbi:hypothetical protein LCGC14_1125560 [marine sediment metagenome]|uniref:Uncharacterized protein n=1 Tax=marine sediment metagenome TaxID=412755 RepID=A0A0F9Q8G7_9ZZZZ
MNPHVFAVGMIAGVVLVAVVVGAIKFSLWLGSIRNDVVYLKSADKIHTHDHIWHNMNRNQDATDKKIKAELATISKTVNEMVQSLKGVKNANANLV